MTRSKNKFEFIIRVPNTALGTIWIECFKMDTLYLRPWWHGRRGGLFNGQNLPFFCAELLKVKGRWTVADFSDSTDKDAPKWPRGARAKVPGIVLEIGAAWAAENGKVMREHQTEWLKWEVEAAAKGRCVSRDLNIALIREAVRHAAVLDRFDLLRPAQPFIQSIAGEFSQAKRRLSTHRGRLGSAAA